VKVVVLYLLYNFYYWIFSSFIQENLVAHLWNWLNETTTARASTSMRPTSRARLAAPRVARLFLRCTDASAPSLWTARRCEASARAVCCMPCLHTCPRRPKPRARASASCGRTHAAGRASGLIGTRDARACLVVVATSSFPSLLIQTEPSWAGSAQAALPLAIAAPLPRRYQAPLVQMLSSMTIT
jgi:hypothetical protein